MTNQKRVDGFRKYLGATNEFNLDDKSFNTLVGLVNVLNSLDKKTFNVYCNANKNDFYNWIYYSIGDHRLARDIMNIRIKENMVDIIERRIVDLKDFARHPENSQILKKIDMYIDHVKFYIDNEVCSNCEICSLVCPKEAVVIKDGKKTVSDDCTLCGFCENFCPVECIEHTNNDDRKDFYHENKMIPLMPKSHEINQVNARKLFKGKHTVKSDCPPGCELCVAACPINIMHRFDGNKERKKVKTCSSKCLMCGACMNACPHDLIEIKRVHIIHDGDEYSNTWNLALEMLTRVENKSFYHNNQNHNKIVGLVNKTGIRKFKDIVKDVEEGN